MPSLSVDLHQQHGLVSSVAHTVPSYLQDPTCEFVANMTQLKAQDFPGHVQTAWACCEVVNLRRLAILCGSIHVAATCMLSQKTTKQYRFYFKLECHNT